MAEDIHVFQGMKRDNHPIKQQKEFLWSAENIRITAREGRDTMLSITNEKGTKELLSIGTDQYIGHAVVGNYLVLFVKQTIKHEGEPDEVYDVIYRFNLDLIDSKTIGNKVILYKGNLNFDTDYPAQIIADYESEFVQKLYWVDGKNPLRLINVAKPELKGEEGNNFTSTYTDAPFDIVPEVSLQEDFLVYPDYKGVGQFPSGVIQYAISYYYKYQQESNIVAVSPVLPIKFENRGGSPEETVTVSFNIEVQNVDTKFDYLRIYSIIRTSLNATPTVKRVVDIDIKNSIGTVDIRYTDTNTSGDIVDNNSILFQKESLIPQCIISKDNTLFIGNIKSQNPNDSDIKLNLSITSGTKLDILQSINSKDLLYNQGFKHGEYYRLGVQLQDNKGVWTPPIDLGVFQQQEYPKKSNDKYYSPIFKCLINGLSGINTTKYKKVRPLYVLPQNVNRRIKAQGVLNPTVFNCKYRQDNSLYAQASWLFRPYNVGIDQYDEVISNPIQIVNGNSTGYAFQSQPYSSIPEFRNNCILGGNGGRGYEIQNILTSTNKERKWIGGPSTYYEQLNGYINVDSVEIRLNDYDDSYYFVEQSIGTFNSPDITQDTILQGNLDIAITGLVNFTNGYGTSSITHTTPQKGVGEIKRAIEDNDGKCLIADTLYEDSALLKQENGQDTFSSINYRWLVHMWHRSGSLNNDRPRNGNQTSKLKTKVFSNIRYANTIFLNPKYGYYSNAGDFMEYVNGFTPYNIQLFNSEELSLNKLTFTKEDTLVTLHRWIRKSTSNFTINDKGSKLWESFNYNIIGNDPGTGGITVDDSLQDRDVSYYYSGNIDTLCINKQPFDIYATALGGVNQDTVTLGYASVTNHGIVHWCKVSEIKVTKGIGGLLDTYTAKIVDSDNPNIKGDNTWTIQSKWNSLYFIHNGSKFSASNIFGYHRTLRSIKKVHGLTPNENILGPIANVSNSVGAVQSTYDANISTDGIRIKYKSTPHVVFSCYPPMDYFIFESWIENEDRESQDDPEYIKIIDKYNNLLLLGDLVSDIKEGKEAYPNRVEDYIYIPAGPSQSIKGLKAIYWTYGDTWIDRYDCLKTYPFTPEDENQVVEIGCFWLESRTNLQGRYDKNKDLIDNTFINNTNFNLINPVYSQLDNFFTYRYLGEDYYKSVEYPNTIAWSQTKTPGADYDNYTSISMANSLSLDGTNGGVTALGTFNEFLMTFQQSGISQILFNSRVQIQATDGVPIEIANSQKVEGTRVFSNSIGCQDKFSMVTTPKGIYFVDMNGGTIYLFDGNLNNIGLQLGSLSWVNDNYTSNTWAFEKEDKNSIRLYYDTRNQDVYFVPGIDKDTRKALCYSEFLGQFTSLMDYGGAVMFPYKSKFYSIARGTDNNTYLWENFANDRYCNIFGRDVDFSISFISNDAPTLTKIFDTIDLRADSYTDNKLDEMDYGIRDKEPISKAPFTHISISNEYQKVTDVQLTNSSIRKKFRVWRITIPRAEDSKGRLMARIRNPWTKITLSNTRKDGSMTILHDLSVRYTV